MTTRRELFPIICARRGHNVAVVVEDDTGRWLEIGHQPVYGNPRAGVSARVPLSGTRTDRIGCRPCHRSVLLAHQQIIDAIGRGDTGMTI